MVYYVQILSLTANMRVVLETATTQPHFRKLLNIGNRTQQKNSST